MAERSGIEWTHVRRPDGTVLRGSTWNVVTGCTKVSAGCKHCYAEREWARFSKAEGTRFFGRPFTDVRCHDDLLELPLRWRAPRGIFVNPRGDLFHESVPFEFVDQVFAVMALAEQHVFQILTKRPERALAYLTEHAAEGRRVRHAAQNLKLPNGRLDFSSAWPLRNVWLGVSIENQETADERIPLLLRMPAAVRWVSAEPLLGPVDIRCWLVINSMVTSMSDLNRVDWVVVGGESGPKARPMHPEWARSLRDQCQAAGVAFNFKQWGEWSPGDSATKVPLKQWREFVDGATESRPVHLWGDRAGDKVMLVARIGKKASGRLLDGRIWDDYPPYRAKG